MSCPSCGNLLQKLSVTTHGGSRFDVDHCGRCGGTWFDPYEIHRIPYHEVAIIAHMSVLPRHSLRELVTHRCPRCHKDLIRSHYESVPRGIRMLRCAKCGGIWATQRSLVEFKKHQDEEVKENFSHSLAFPSFSVLFSPVIAVLLLLFVTFITVFSLQVSQEGRIKAESNISNLLTFVPSSSSINIIFRTRTPLSSSITYSADLFSVKTQTVNYQPSTNHHILLTGLNPKSLYNFTITLQDEKGRNYTTSENSFMTGQ